MYLLHQASTGHGPQLFCAFSSVSVSPGACWPVGQDRFLLTISSGDGHVGAASAGDSLPGTIVKDSMRCLQRACTQVSFLTKALEQDLQDPCDGFQDSAMGTRDNKKQT